MSIVTRRDEIALTNMIESQIDFLEEEVKSNPFDTAKDVKELAKELYSRLENVVMKDPSVNQDLAFLMLQSLKTKFCSSFYIVKDLEEFKQNPSNDKRVWCELCFG